MATGDLQARTRFEPAEVEARILARWLEAGLVHPEAAGTPEENFSIAIPPPNVTGALHMGHALNWTIQDVLIRTNRMRGRLDRFFLRGFEGVLFSWVVMVGRLLERIGDRKETSDLHAFGNLDGRGLLDAHEDFHSANLGI